MAGVPRADAQRSVDAILTAARDVLSEDSGAGLTAIAERAEVHRATVYRHFPTRDALIRRLHEAYLDDAGFAVLETNLEADDLLAEIEALIRRVYAVNLAWRAYAWAPPYSAETRARRSDLTDVTIALFGAAQREGLPAPGPQHPRAARHLGRADPVPRGPRQRRRLDARRGRRLHAAPAHARVAPSRSARTAAIAASSVG